MLWVTVAAVFFILVMRRNKEESKPYLKLGTWCLPVIFKKQEGGKGIFKKKVI